MIDRLAAIHDAACRATGALAVAIAAKRATKRQLLDAADVLARAAFDLRQAVESIGTKETA